MEIISFHIALPLIISIGQIIFLGLFFLLLFIPLLKIAKDEKKEKKEQQKKSGENRLYIRETGSYITLEEAESGEWHEPDEEEKNHIFTLRKQYMTESEIASEITLKEFYEFLKTEGYTKENLPNYYDVSGKLIDKFPDFDPNQEKIDFLEKTFIVKQNLHDSITNLWTLNDKTISIINGSLLFWVKVNHASGHYFMKKLTDVDRFLGKLLHKDDIHLKKHRVFTVKRGFDITKAKKLFEKFDNEGNLKVELIDDNLLIKVFALPNREDFERINKLI